MAPRPNAEAWAITLANRRLIYTYMRTRCPQLPDREGVRGDLLLALHSACLTWDSQRATLATWAYKHFTAAMQPRWRAQRRERSLHMYLDHRVCRSPAMSLIARMELARVSQCQAPKGRAGQALVAFLADPEEGQSYHAARAGVSRQALSAALGRHLRRVHA